jgi:hypothetical protein
MKINSFFGAAVNPYREDFITLEIGVTYTMLGLYDECGVNG